MNLFSCVAFGLSLKLPSETILLNSSAHEFLGAGSSLPTTGSKIESKLKLGCSIILRKTILGQEKLFFAVRDVHNDKA